MRKIIKNAIQCKTCNEIIETTENNGVMIWCKCKACAIGGGFEKTIRWGCPVDFIDVGEYAWHEEKTIEQKYAEAIEEMKCLIDGNDVEVEHTRADSILTNYLLDLGYTELIEIYGKVWKYYS